MKTITLIAALLLAPAAYAEQVAEPPAAATPVKPDKPAKLTKEELQVLAHYHALDKKEVDLGKYALKVSKSDGVKEHGKLLVTDHGESSKELLAFAKKHGQIIPAKKPADEVEKKEMAEDKAKIAKLKKLKGVEFDAAYLTAMVDGHEKELSKVDTMAAKCENIELADMIRGKKTTLQHHADAARELQKGSSPTASTVTAPSTKPSHGAH